MGEYVYPIYDIGRHRQGGPTVAVKVSAGGKTIEIVATLGVAGRTKGNGAGGACGHGVIMVFVDLSVGTEFGTTMLGEVDVHTSDDGAWDKGIRGAVLWWEAVEPEVAGVDHFDDHARGHFCEWERVVNTASALLDGANMALNLGNMFVVGDSVESYFEICKIGALCFKFPIHHKMSDSETALNVDGYYMFDGIQYSLAFLVAQHFGSAELYTT